MTQKISPKDTIKAESVKKFTSLFMLKVEKKLQDNILMILSLIWIIALFVTYFPMGESISQNLNFSGDYQNKINFFLASTGLVSFAFFIKSLNLIRKP